eukprot:157369-Prymnesium_polylepis.1
MLHLRDRHRRTAAHGVGQQVLGREAAADLGALTDGRCRRRPHTLADVAVSTQCCQPPRGRARREHVRLPLPAAPRRVRVPPDQVRAGEDDEVKAAACGHLASRDGASAPLRGQMVQYLAILVVATRVGALAGAPASWTIVGARLHDLRHLRTRARRTAAPEVRAVAIDKHRLSQHRREPALRRDDSERRDARNLFVLFLKLGPGRVLVSLVRVPVLEVQEDTRGRRSAERSQEVVSQRSAHQRRRDRTRSTRDAKGDRRRRTGLCRAPCRLLLSGRLHELRPGAQG